MLRRGFNGAEEKVPRTDLREPRPKADLDTDNCHAGGTRVIEDACGTSQEGVFVVFGVDGNNAGLAIHAQDGRVSRVQRKCGGHIAPHTAEGFLQDSS
jgi:threonine aldolase